MDSSSRSIDSAFGRLFLEARKARGLSQEAVVAEMKERGYPLHVTAVGKIERGERKVSVGEASALASSLGLTVDGLIGGDSAIDGRYESLGVAKQRLFTAFDAYATAILELARAADGTPDLREDQAAAIAATVVDETPAQLMGLLDWFIRRKLGDAGVERAGKHVRLLLEASERDTEALKRSRDDG